MNEETLKTELIETAIAAACMKYNADPAKLGPVLRDAALVVEHGGKAVVAVRLEAGRDIPMLSNKTGYHDVDTPKTIAEYTEDLKADGTHAEAFGTSKREEKPAVETKDNGLIDGTWTSDEFLRLCPGEMMSVARRVDPNGRQVRPHPRRSGQGGSGMLTESDLLTLKPSEMMNRARGIV